MSQSSVEEREISFQPLTIPTIHQILSYFVLITHLHTHAACNCNNHSSVCHFDENLYIASGLVSGGVCEECGDNTEGVQCERCQLGYYPNPDVPFASPEACMRELDILLLLDWAFLGHI